VQPAGTTPQPLDGWRREVDAELVRAGPDHVAVVQPRLFDRFAVDAQDRGFGDRPYTGPIGVPHHVGEDRRELRIGEDQVAIFRGADQEGARFERSYGLARPAPRDLEFHARQLPRGTKPGVALT